MSKSPAGGNIGPLRSVDSPLIYPGDGKKERSTKPATAGWRTSNTPETLRTGEHRSILLPLSGSHARLNRRVCVRACDPEVRSVLLSCSSTQASTILRVSPEEPIIEDLDGPFKKRGFLSAPPEATPSPVKADAPAAHCWMCSRSQQQCQTCRCHRVPSTIQPA